MIVEHIEAVLSDVIITSYEGDCDEETGEFHGMGYAKLDNECLYEGKFHNGKFHGKGKFTWANGVTYEGDFVDNQITGSGIYSYIDGSVYTGQVLNGKRHGQGKLINSLQQTYDGEWKNGMRHGVGRMSFNDEGNMVYHGDWSNNLRHGYGTMSYPSGNHYEGQWKDDQKSGFGIMIWKDLDEVYTGNWEHDKPHGYGEHIWGESTAKTIKKQHCNMFRGEFQEGKRHGKGTFFYMNGSQYTGYWENDLKHGAGVFVHPDGRITSGDYELNRMITFEPETPTTTSPIAATNNGGSGKPTTASTMGNSGKRPNTQMSSTGNAGRTMTAGNTMSNTNNNNNNVSNGRATEDISPQYHLNIMDVLTTSYPIPMKDRKGKSMEDLQVMHKKTISEIERILLKYNQYLKLVYKKYNEAANRQRQRQQAAMSSSGSQANLTSVPSAPALGGHGSKPPNPPHNSNNAAAQAAANAALAAIFVDQSSRWKKIMSATKQARSIHKRFYCCSLEQMLRILREMDIVGTYFNAFDFVKVFKSMRMEHLRVARDQYRQFIRDHFANNPTKESDGSGENKEGETVEGGANGLSVATAEIGEEEQQKLKKEVEEKMQEEIEYILSSANISIGKLLDDYEEQYSNNEEEEQSSDDLNYFNYYYYHAQWNQPILEHEFVELFVRCIAESYGRRGVSEQYLTLNQAVEKILAQKLLPLARESDQYTIFPVLRDLYSDRIQDYLQANRMTLASTIWKKLRNNNKDTMYTYLQPKSTTMENAIPWGGYCRIGVLVDLFYEHREALLAENITKEEIIETFFPINSITMTHINQTKKDYSAVSRRMNFDDFIEYSMRLMNSVYWTNGVVAVTGNEGDENGGLSKEPSLAPQDSTSTQSTGDMHASELQKKMEKLLEVVNK